MHPYTAQQQQAANAYKASSYHGRSEAELMAEVISKVIKQLYMGQDAYSARKLDVMCKHTEKALHILDVLREELLSSDAFTDAEAAEPAKFLLQAYTDSIKRIGMVLSTPAPKDEFAAIIDKLTPVYRAWHSAAAGSNTASETMPAEASATAAV